MDGNNAEKSGDEDSRSVDSTNSSLAEKSGNDVTSVDTTNSSLAEKPGYKELRKQQVETFHSTINEMKNDVSTTDVIIICEGKELPVHKFMLVATCSFYRDLFKSQFKESQTNRVEMPTISSSVMEMIINFMYCKHPSDILYTTLDIAIEAMKASHLLGYESLASECWFRIKDELSMENYKIIWDLSSVYGFDKYLEQVTNFLLNNLIAVLSDDQFLNLNPNQISKLLEVANKNGIMIQDDFVKRILEWVKNDETKRQTNLLEFFSHINFNALSHDYLSFLTKEEPLVYKDNEILLKLVTFMLPKLNKEVPELENKEVSAISPSEEVGLNACFLGFCENSKDKGFIQRVNLKEQTKEKVFQVPFPITTESTTFVRSKSLLYVVGDKRDSSTYSFCVYDAAKKECKYKRYLITSGKTNKIIGFVDHKERICIGNVYENNQNEVYMYNEDISKWVSLFKTLDTIWTICSSMTGKDDLYILVYHNYGDNMRQFRMYKLKDETTIDIAEDILLSRDVGSNLITIFDNKFYLFEFNFEVSRCIICDPLSAEWKSVALDFHLPDPLGSWKIFSRKDSILFFSYKKTFEYYPKTHETIDVCEETTHDLRLNFVCKMNKTPGHVYMWLE